MIKITGTKRSKQPTNDQDDQEMTGTKLFKRPKQPINDQNDREITKTTNK